MNDVQKPDAKAIANRYRDLRIASFSDVHLGHPQTPTELIIKNLRKAFPDNAETAELDLILLGGDLFDDALHYNDSDLIRQIEGWMYSFLYLCAKHHIVLRVLEGTKSHDRGQSSHFLKIKEAHNLDVDLRYITEVSVEKHPQLQTSILYVPDFSLPEVDSIWMQVLNALMEAGLDRVGYANIHGAFTYQMPDISSVQMASHQMDRYLSVVENYIWTGHIHESSVYQRIYSNGSFDRLAHGTESPKGHWRALVRKNGEDDIVFMENTGAKIYLSLNLSALPIEEAMTKVEAVANTLPPHSALRLLLSKSDVLLAAFSQLKKNYPLIQWSTKSVEMKDVQKQLLVDLRDEFQAIPITKENITELLLERIKKRTEDPAILQRCASYLEEHV